MEGSTITSVMDFAADRLKPLVEVTKRFKGLLFTETDRRAVLVEVEWVIPALERRRDNGYEDACRIVGDLLEVFWVSRQPSIPSFVDRIVIFTLYYAMYNFSHIPIMR